MNLALLFPKEKADECFTFHCGAAAVSNYTIISPEEVQPGDTYKFIPAAGAPPIFAQVVAVRPEQNLVQIVKNNSLPVWTHIRPIKGQVFFGRPNPNNPPAQPPVNQYKFMEDQ